MYRQSEAIGNKHYLNQVSPIKPTLAKEILIVLIFILYRIKNGVC